MSYFVAFMETFTISAFPYYTFENRSQAYTIGYFAKPSLPQLSNSKVACDLSVFVVLHWLDGSVSQFLIQFTRKAVTLFPEATQLGSAFYAIYLIISLPLFARLDEGPGLHVGPTSKKFV